VWWAVYLLPFFPSCWAFWGFVVITILAIMIIIVLILINLESMGWLRIAGVLLMKCYIYPLMALFFVLVDGIIDPSKVLD